MEVSEDKKEEQKESIGDYVDNYTITPNYEHPRFKELMSEFEKQEHRFEIDTCEFKYNGKSFFLGDSPEKIADIFGEPDEEPIYSLDNSVYTYKYKTLGLKLRFTSNNNKLKYYLLNISRVLYDDQITHNIVKFRNMPYQKDMTLNDFMTFSDLNHDKLKRNRFNFLIRQKECPLNKRSRIRTTIISKPVYKTLGGGHLTYTGDFDPAKSNDIEGVEVLKETLEDILKK